MGRWVDEGAKNETKKRRFRNPQREGKRERAKETEPEQIFGREGRKYILVRAWMHGMHACLGRHDIPRGQVSPPPSNGGETKAGLFSFLSIFSLSFLPLPLPSPCSFAIGALATLQHIHIYTHSQFNASCL